ncbi:MAG TPA: uroporphyrinogen decarboxylase [Candidatus Saccharimonadales bacterium]|nr:uroporphyrinogen decarboxylase [Candidatus Saccharimonadales bacterium]
MTDSTIVPAHPGTAWTGERRMLAACRLEPVDATPVWFMRQAGRSLAAYRALRERYEILTLAKTPELCAEVTLMPVRELGVDAAVLFADIMLPLEPMGVSLEIQPDVGPIIHHPIRSAADVARLRLFEPAEGVAFVLDALRIVRRELAGRQAVIGFSGSPFTLACYLIEGRPSRDYAIAKAFMYGQPVAWHELMTKLSEVVARYLDAQVDAGAQVVQLFDSWVGILGPADYETFVLPHVRSIFQRVTRVPTIHFGTAAATLLELMASAGGDVMSIDSRQSLAAAWERLGPARGLQGNLDGARVLAGWEATVEGAQRVLTEAGGRPGHVFNLGHGVLPGSDPDLLRRLVDLVHETTARAQEACQ